MTLRVARTYIICCFFLVFCPCLAVLAQDDPGLAAGGTERGEVVVEVKGVTGAEPGPKTDLQARPETLEMEADETSRLSLVEMLEGVPGVSVVELGGDEGPWYLMIRGMQGPGVAVYLDGILINDPLGRRPDLSRVPLSLVDEVAVYRGAAPFGYPVSGVSGVVDIKTSPASSERAAQARLAADSLSTITASASITQGFGRGSGLMSTSHQWGPGKYLYNNDQGTYLNRGDDREETRSHNAFADHDVILKWDRKAGDYVAYAAGYYQERHHELAGRGGVEADQARQWTQLVLVYAGLMRPGVISPSLDAEVRIHALQEESWFVDEDGELGPSRHDIDLRTRLGSDFYLDYYGLQNHHLSLYLGLYEDEYFPESEIDPQVEKISCLRSSVYLALADEFKLIEGRFKLKPRLHYSYEGNRYSGPTLVEQSGKAKDTTAIGSAAAGLSVSFLLTHDLQLVAQTGQYYRAPGFREEFGDRINLVGNPDLVPERSLNQELGLVYEPGPVLGLDSFRAEFMIFENNLEHKIGWVALPDGSLKADNTGDARVSGAELSMGLAQKNLVYVNASYAFQDAVNLSDNKIFEGNELAGVPRNAAHLGITLSRPFGKIYYELDYQDMRYLDEANRVRAAPRLIHNLGAVYRQGRYAAGIKAINLGNDLSPEALGYPVPGVHYQIFMEVKGG